jgi:membrane-associated phospholipid phosphatase
MLTQSFMHANAQRSKADSVSYLASYWYDGIGLLERPLKWNGEQWVTAGGLLAFTGAMVTLDEAINIPAANWNSTFAEDFGKAGEIAGGVPVQLGISGGAILVGTLAHNNHITNFGLDNLQAQIFTGGMAFLFKNLSHRARPETGEGAFAWYGPINGWGNQSFFSGHTAMAFCTANMLFLHSHKKWWVGVLAFGGATAVGISRMQQQKHWGSDVVMGAIMGTAVSSWVYKQQEKRRMVRHQVKPAFH